MSWYRPTTVEPELREALVCGWTARIAGGQLLVPDGCVDVMWLDDGRVVVCGPETAAWPVTTPPGTEAVGVRFRPGVAPDVLNTPAHEIVDARVGLDHVLGPRARGLATRIGDAATPELRLAVLLGAACRWLADSDGPDPRVAWTVRALSRQSRSIAELADAAGLTERQLQRRSRTVFGYPPSMLRIILRLQRFMALARSPDGGTLGLADLAHLAGYSDQAHLSHDCRRIAGTTPTELLAGQAPDWHGEGAVVDAMPVGIQPATRSGTPRAA